MAGAFTWKYPAPDINKFTALSNLLILRNGGQVEPGSTFDFKKSKTEADYACKDGNEIWDGKLKFPDRNRARFLDCLAEFVSSKEGGPSVACTAMSELDEGVVIYITRNAGFEDLHVEALEKRLPMLLHRVRRTRVSTASVNALWHFIFVYQKSRIEERYVPELMSSLRSCSSFFKSTIEDNCEKAFKELSQLRESALEPCPAPREILQRNSALALQAADLRLMPPVKRLLLESNHSTDQTRILWKRICALAKPAVALKEFRRAAIKFDSFHNVRVHLVNYDMDSVPHMSPRAFSLKETLKLLDLDHTLPLLDSVVGPGKSIEEIDVKFRTYQNSMPGAHAEVQLLLYLCKEETIKHLGKLVRYFGCSKFGCFMCSHFLRAHGMIFNRGSHSRHFGPWTVPDSYGLACNEASNIAKALLQVHRDVKNILQSGRPARTQPVKTSYIDSDSTMPSHTGSRVDWLAMAMYETSGQGFQTHMPLLMEGRSVENREEANPGECVSCLGTSVRMCTVCNRVPYCINKCQKTRGGRLCLSNRRRNFTTADYLFISILHNKLPEFEDVREDFGFDCLTSRQDQKKLLNIYRGLLELSMNTITADKVSGLQLTGTLFKTIQQHLYAVPEPKRGKFGWFAEKLKKATYAPSTLDSFDRKFLWALRQGGGAANSRRSEPSTRY